jgi:cell division GTPase FtsZ
MTLIKESVAPEAHVFYGQVIDPNLDDRIKITVIATGFPTKKPGSSNHAQEKKYQEREKDNGLDVDFNRPAYTYWRPQKLK